MLQNDSIIFFSAYPPHVGGLERYTHEVAMELAKRGHRIVVVTSSLDGSPDFEQSPDGKVTVYRLPSWHLISGRMPVIKPGPVPGKVANELRKLPNPKVIVQTFLFPLSLFGARLAKKEGWPCILINHGSNYVCQGKTLVDALEHVYEHVMARLVSRRCAASYAVSGAALDWLRHFGVEADGILYNSVDYRAIEKVVSNPGEGFRRTFGIGEDTMLVAFAARMVPGKGIVEFVEAISQLVDEGADIAAIIAGDGPMLKQICGCERKGIHFLGETPREDVLRLFKESDCYCIPSNYAEGFPTTVLEAIVCKCYVVTAPYGGAKEIISDAEYGTVMQSNTKEDIVGALRPLLNDKRHMIRCVDAAYQRFLSGFTWNATCEKIENIKWI